MADSDTDTDTYTDSDTDTDGGSNHDASEQEPGAVEETKDKCHECEDEGSGVYSDTKRCTSLLHTAYHCFKEGLYTDVTVVVEGTRFDTHRLVLASLSDFFPPLFKMDHTNKGEVTVHQVFAEDFALLLRFAYTGTIKFTRENIQGILTAADYLGVNVVRAAGQKFMAENLDSENVWDVLRFAENYTFTELKQDANTYLCKIFESTITTPGFYQVDVDYLVSFLEDDNLILYDDKKVLRSLEREELIFKSVLSYLSQVPEPEESVFSKLIPAVRLSTLTMTQKVVEIWDSYPHLKNNKILVTYLEIAQHHLKCMKEKITNNIERIPPSWHRFRKLANFSFIHSSRRYSADTFRNPPDILHKDPDLEINEIVFFKSHSTTGLEVIAGFTIRYRRPGDATVVETDICGTVRRTSSRSQCAKLELDEYITGVRINEGAVLDGLTFETSNGRILGPYGGTGGTPTREQAPEGTMSRLYEISCESTSNWGMATLNNLMFRWIKFH